MKKEYFLCKYCGKKMYNKRAMGQHEKHCFRNPLSKEKTKPSENTTGGWNANDLLVAFNFDLDGNPVNPPLSDQERAELGDLAVTRFFDVLKHHKSPETEEEIESGDCNLSDDEDE